MSPTSASARTPRKMTGAQALLEGLVHEGVDVIFGYPGGQALPLYDALYDSPIRHILVRHEQGAAHMADGYARSTGKVGVCLATSGPGATNLVTGIATAYMDSIPMVAITGQVGTGAIGKDSFQEADITGITMPVTKHSYLVKDAAEIPHVVKEAFLVASTGRPGPVLIDIPRDMSVGKLEFHWDDIHIRLRGYKPTTKGNTRMIRRALEVLLSARKPVIMAGGGVNRANAAEELTTLARLLRIPVTTTLLGKGCFPELDPLALGAPGMHGTAYANYAIDQADVILCIGARFDDRVTGNVSKFAPHARIIHIDVDPAEIGKVMKTEVPVVGDAREVICEMLAELAGRKDKFPDFSEWDAQIAAWKEQYPLKWATGHHLCPMHCGQLAHPGKCGSTQCEDGHGLIKPPAVVRAIWERTGGNAIVATDVGQNQMWAMQYYLTREPRQFLSSGGMGTMGFGLPAAIGAQIGNPDREVWCIAGDGGIQMNSQELATAVIHELPLKIAVLNNGCLGMVRQWQHMFYGKRYSQVGLDVGTPDFVKLAEAYGAVGLRVTDPAAVCDTIDAARAITNRPVLMEFVCEMQENVFPMIPGGASVAEMVLE
jgi:acetolactate synthase I/II/III large subunit